ncbi:hypothetical protein SPRG_00657 [Saprolegnia parasitica CBS 223.65]|uniref:Uncharacterized protein n=1 Tax=Saprolegnia parasitica (strain CBS 223.65) TaxID=695850 RepID=A0A067CV62_SAPPC|nr:hypothetical protein SPRG_00657 [Saprolegnia parasitica CBS 223.65]KDO34594.1 hypothetical protein SPRG_00657 [Saprolegnia parasitica CBS 223.65]|eukprot:XP_012194271.1 hypothetical protein SPRG_00657 [Saprolegnia parasitica CBS 223.65]
MLGAVTRLAVARASSSAVRRHVLRRPAMARMFASEGNDSVPSNTSRFLKLVDQIEEDDAVELDDGDEVVTEVDPQDEFFVDLNPGGVGLSERDDKRIFDLYMENPLINTIKKLSTDNRVSVERIEATIVFQGLERGLTIEELREKVFALKEAKAKDQAMPVTEAAGSKAKVHGRNKSIEELALEDCDHGKSDEDMTEADFMTNEEWEEYNKEDKIREPDFIYLSDEHDELPPLHRQYGKRNLSDQLSVAEAKALQIGAMKNRVTLLPSFAKSLNPTGKWKIAIKDISTKRSPLYMRDTDGTLRLATDDEVVKRSWVKRPSYFQGIEKFVY